MRISNSLHENAQGWQAGGEAVSPTAYCNWHVPHSRRHL